MLRYIIVYFLIILNIYSNTGTKEHFEQEFRKAYTLPHNFNSQSIREVEEIILKVLSSREFSTEKLFGEEYFLGKKFHAFLFKDYYYDTDDYKLMNQNSVYRLRYRWKNASDYFKYKFLPLRSYYPLRCEIQYKYDYNFSKDLSTMKEVRFEFRNESFPFSKNKNAPPPPWDYSEYRKYLKTGQYQEYSILPSNELVKRHNINLNNLNEKLIIETIRIRNHINIRNIFGDEPNPEQIGIVTFDLVYPNIGKPFLEVELELDRSIGANLNEILESSRREIEIKEFVRKIKESLIFDIKIIRDEILKELENNYRLKELTPNFKFKRVISNDY